MNSYIPKEQDCAAVDELSKSLLFKSVLIVKIGLCFCGLLLITYEFFVKRNGLKIALHENATIICNFIRFFLAWICIGYICTHTFDFIRLSKSVESPCDRLAKSFSVILLRMVTTVATNAQIVALFILAFERFLCTKFLVRYENSAKPALILIALITLFYKKCV
uniref:Uncharacterized protein n=1 Tax=Panagrolaimus sp. PS1159 TaxID=55785 RepID=A0AC35F763_9BILA